MLNFGCGRDIRKGWVNADIQKGKKIKSFDFDKFPYPFKKNTFDYVFAKNILEHLNNPLEALHELWKVCKNGAIIEVIVPYWNCEGAHSDITHKNFWSEHAIDIIVNPNKHYSINPKKKFRLVSLELNPTPIGKFVPFRRIISHYIAGIVNEMKFKLEIIK